VGGNEQLRYRETKVPAKQQPKVGKEDDQEVEAIPTALKEAKEAKERKFDCHLGCEYQREHC
jgi:hypothetical protein